MKINTKLVLKNVKGEPLNVEDNVPATIGEILGNILFNHKTGGKMKCYILGQKLATAERIVEVDSSDFFLIKEAVNSNDVYNNLVSGQLIEYFDKIEKEEEKSKEKSKK